MLYNQNNSLLQIKILLHFDQSKYSYFLLNLREPKITISGSRSGSSTTKKKKEYSYSVKLSAVDRVTRVESSGQESFRKPWWTQHKGETEFFEDIEKTNTKKNQKAFFFDQSSSPGPLVFRAAADEFKYDSLFLISLSVVWWLNEEESY